MGKSLAYKILSEKLVSGELVPGTGIGIEIDQTLTQDSTGNYGIFAVGSDGCRTCCS